MVLRLVIPVCWAFLVVSMSTIGCQGDPSSGTPYSCTPGELGCTDENSVDQCTEDNQWVVVEDCGSGYCFWGMCILQAPPTDIQEEPWDVQENVDTVAGPDGLDVEAEVDSSDMIDPCACVPGVNCGVMPGCEKDCGLPCGPGSICFEGVGLCVPEGSVGTPCDESPCNDGAPCLPTNPKVCSGVCENEMDCPVNMQCLEQPWPDGSIMLCVPVCPEAPVCDPKSCGFLADGCGTWVPCGDCSGEDESCSEANLCVSDCLPYCFGEACGDDGCGGSCGTCGDGLCCDEGQCLDCTAAVSLNPDCVHVPHHIHTGDPIPIAVYRSNPPCAAWDHVEIDVAESGELLVDLVGAPQEGECPPCELEMAGLVWLPGLTSGTHIIQVGSLDGRIIEISEAPTTEAPGPAWCGDSCTDLTGTWNWTYHGVDLPPTIACGYENQLVPMEMTVTMEPCHQYSLSAEGWLGPTTLSSCPPDTVSLLGGQTWPEELTYEGSGTFCGFPTPGGEPTTAILGIVHGQTQEETRVFVIESETL